MPTYARLQNGVVAELFATTAPIATLFPPGLSWVDVTATPQVAVGWLSQGNGFAAPPQAVAPTIPVLTIAATLSAMQAQLTALQTQLTQISASVGSKT